MNRDYLVLVLVALFTISVIAVAASSINTVGIESGFGIEGGSGNLSNATPSNASSEKVSGSGGSGFLSSILSWELGVESGSTGSPDSGTSGLVIAILLGLVAGSIGLIFWITSDDTTLSTTPESASSERISDGTEVQTEESVTVDSTNEVYRAWWGMVQSLDMARSQSRSPAEFATAAINAGMDPEKVTELTALFRSVRYGNEPVTNEVEQRASEVSNQMQSHTSAATQGDTES